jgi:hypothetical protein
MRYRSNLPVRLEQVQRRIKEYALELQQALLDELDIDVRVDAKFQEPALNDWHDIWLIPTSKNVKPVILAVEAYSDNGNDYHVYTSLIHKKDSIAIFNIDEVIDAIDKLYLLPIKTK